MGKVEVGLLWENIFIHLKYKFVIVYYYVSESVCSCDEIRNKIISKNIKIANTPPRILEISITNLVVLMGLLSITNIGERSYVKYKPGYFRLSFL